MYCRNDHHIISEITILIPVYTHENTTTSQVVVLWGLLPFVLSPDIPSWQQSEHSAWLCCKGHFAGWAGRWGSKLQSTLVGQWNARAAISRQNVWPLIQWCVQPITAKVMIVVTSRLKCFVVVICHVSCTLRKYIATGLYIFLFHHT